MTSAALVLLGLKPRISESDAALIWFGLAGFSSAACRAADGFAATLADFKTDSAFADATFAIARTSSRLNAMGLVAALRARMLSRKADFFEGLPMVAAGRGGGGAGEALTGGVLGEALGFGASSGFRLAVVLGFCLAMGY